MTMENIVNREHRRNWLSKVHRLRQQRGWDIDENRIIMFFSTINGYHHFHTMPTEFGEEEYVMMGVPEPENRYDNLAVLVLEENSNQIIGRVPRYICNTTSLGFRVSKKLVRALCLYTGTYHNDGPIQGGGIKLHCVYVLEYEPSTFMQEIVQVAGFLKDHVPDDYIYL